MSFAKIRPRRGTANQWSNANPILSEGEIGIEVPSTGVGTGTVKIKFGDGSSHWNALPYGLDTPNISDVISDEFISGTPCTSGNYYIANDKLYKCIADTDGSINVTNSNYFEETSVAGEVKTLNERLTQYKVKEYTFEYTTTKQWISCNIEESNGFLDGSSYLDTTDQIRYPLNYSTDSFCHISYKGPKKIDFWSIYAGTVHAFLLYK